MLMYIESSFFSPVTRDHFAEYENNQIGKLGARTIEERIGLIKRIYETLVVKRSYHGSNPLQHWEAECLRKAQAKGSRFNCKHGARVPSVREY